ncbi:MAG: tRNA (guanosine(46)-N7)-methyltransferase TrmB [Candidatus Rifleibacteriota bacterium]
MGKKKLIRFEQNKKFACLCELDAKQLIDAPHVFRGKWSPEFFGNDHELVLELGCGRGEYTLGLARLEPEKNFIGVDIKGSRLFFGAREVHETRLANAGFIRSKIDFIDRIFGREVTEIWITFPDPFSEKPNRRLTSPVFLNKYHEILKPHGVVTLKTDDSELYEFTLWIARKNGLKILKKTTDLYGQAVANTKEAIKTTYERKFLDQNKKICLLSFILDRKVEPLK